MKRFLFLLLSLVLTFGVAVADEGMWVPLFLKGYTIEQMKAKGLKLSAEDIYSINHSSLKDAILIFGGGCTGSVISPEGLVLTNHHCGYSYIVNHSTVEHDYLTNGFWAATKADELPNPGLTVKFLVYMEDVTDKILPQIPQNIPEAKRQQLINKIIRQIEDSVENHWNGKYIASVESFFYGNQYIMMVMQEFKDVRLVGAPPSAIGKFGGETDNWMWPRHTGDFSLFRIYVNKDNEPAEYSPDNVPYRPKRYLKISLGGYSEGSFTMVYGFPGHTQEYVPSYTVDFVMNTIDPTRIKIRQAKLDVLMPALNIDTKTRLQYAKQVSRVANGWKKWKGEIKGLRRLQALKKKRQFEEKFRQWTQTDEGKPYQGLLEAYKQVYKRYGKYQKAFYYFIETVYYTEAFDYVQSINKLLDKIEKAQSEDQYKQLTQQLVDKVQNYWDKHRMSVERQLMNNILKIYAQDLANTEFIPSAFAKMQQQTQNYSSATYSAGLGDVFFADIIFSKSRLEALLAKYPYKKRSKLVQNIRDNSLALELTDQFYSIYFDKIRPYYRQMQLQLDSLNRLYMKAQMLMQPERVFYPDANFTLRIAYGTVGGYKPRDAVWYDYYTTLEGIIEKDDPDIYDYDVPDKLKQLYYSKDYGPYAAEDGKMHVAFIANNHTTGGNSGSPVLDANGNLIGLNFDRTWESTMSDLMYDPNRCRNIMVDIRYILFLIDKFAGAKRLIDEMEIIE